MHFVLFLPLLCVQIVSYFNAFDCVGIRLGRQSWMLHGWPKRRRKRRPNWLPSRPRRRRRSKRRPSRKRGRN
jgi:hypothetical protein